MPLRFDDSNWPLLRLTIPPRFSQSEWDDHVRQAREYLKRGEPFAVLNDSRNAQFPNATQRRQVVEWIDSRASEPVLGVALVTRSALVVGAATAISWLVSGRNPFRVVRSMHQAEAWLIDLLKEHYAPGVSPKSQAFGAGQLPPSARGGSPASWRPARDAWFATPRAAARRGADSDPALRATAPEPRLPRAWPAWSRTTARKSVEPPSD